MEHDYPTTSQKKSDGTKKRGGKSPRIRYTAERARQFLVDNIAKTRNVGDWAEQIGCSQNWLGQPGKLKI